MPSRDDDIETMPEDDLLTIPSGNIPSRLICRVKTFGSAQNSSHQSRLVSVTR